MHRIRKIFTLTRPSEFYKNFNLGSGLHKVARFAEAAAPIFIDFRSLWLSAPSRPSQVLLGSFRAPSGMLSLAQAPNSFQSGSLSLFSAPSRSKQVLLGSFRAPSLMFLLRLLFVIEFLHLKDPTAATRI